MNWSGWTEIPIAKNLRTSALEPLDRGRAPGMHYGSIIHEARILKGQTYKPMAGEQEGLRIQEGFWWESAVEYMMAGATRDEAIDLAFKRYMTHLHETLCTQVQLSRDEIQMTPDAFDAVEGCLHSYKSTRKKLPWTQPEFEFKFWDWIMQEAGYCLAAGVDTVRWYVHFQSGDYSRGIGTGPRAMTSSGTFTQEELELNWENALAIRDLIRAREERVG